MPSTKRIDELDVFLVAKSCTTRAEFFDRHRWAYNFASKNKILEQVCSHMALGHRYSPVKWSHFSAKQEALKYRSRSEFKRKSAGAYCFLKDAGALSVACMHMDQGYQNWHVFELKAAAMRYATRREFKTDNYAAYAFARVNGLLDEVCSHMDGKESWDQTKVLFIAKKFTSMAEFRSAWNGAFNHAYRHGYLEQACSHMPPPEYGFSKIKPANLYYLKIKTADGVELFKIGITNRDARSRIRGMGVPDGATVQVIKTFRFEDGREARMMEKSYHKAFSEFRYRGLPVLKNGNTELFTMDVLS